MALYSPTTTYSLNELFATAALDTHNTDRGLHGVVPLVWNETLFQYAAWRADTYECHGQGEGANLTHLGTNPYGENLAIGYTPIAEGSVGAWYNEILMYNFLDPGFEEATGHFTQMIWNATRRLGCAYKYCNPYWGTYVVCVYDPPGNVVGGDFFQQNVPPPLSELWSVPSASVTATPASTVVVEALTTVRVTRTAGRSTSSSLSSGGGVLLGVSWGVFAVVINALV